MLCAQCGHSNASDSRFCSACGHPLDAPSLRHDDTRLLPVTTIDASDSPESVPSPDVSAGGWVLVVRRGPNAGSRFVLEGATVTAGRSPDCDIFLDDVTVSRCHARFLPVGAAYEVRDEGSLNGTYLNHERIEVAPLANGDEVQIGKYRLVVLAGVAS